MDPKSSHHSHIIQAKLMKLSTIINIYIALIIVQKMSTLAQTTWEYWQFEFLRPYPRFQWVARSKCVLSK